MPVLLKSEYYPSTYSTEYKKKFIMHKKVISMFFIFFFCRDMHAHQCGEQFEGLCTEMMSIDGETLLRFLRNVTFEGKTNVPF